MKRFLYICLAFALLIVVFSIKTQAIYAQTGTYTCNWIEDINVPGAGKCEVVEDKMTTPPIECTDGHIPGNECDGLDFLDCSNKSGIKYNCTPVSSGVGYRCDYPNPVCIKCDLSEEGCYDTEEDFCYESCVFSGGNTYSCSPDGRGCITIEGLGGKYTDFLICESKCGYDPVDDSKLKLECKTESGGRGINTAIGCIPIKTNTEFLSFLLRWSMGVAGGFAVLLILYASFIFITSQGDKYKVIAGKELLTAAIAGLVFLILSVFLLRVIGVDILGINQTLP